MEIDKLTRESIASYLPVPGVNKWFGLAVLLVIVPAFLWTLLYPPAEIWARMPGLVLLLMAATLAAPALIAAAIVWGIAGRFSGSEDGWWRAFWNRNVIGYELWCARSLYGDPTISYEIRRRDVDELWRSPGKTVIIVFPLCRNASCRVDIPDFSRSWWKIQTSDIVFGSDGGVKLVVEMRDWNGNRFPVDVRHALRILANERSSLLDDRLTESVGSIGKLVEGLMDRLDAAKSDLAAERTSLAAERTDRDAAVAELHEAAARIDATKRFGRSDQAMGIRAWLVERFRAHEAVRPVALPGQVDC